MMMMPFDDAHHVPKLVNPSMPVVTPSPMNVGAKPSVARSQPESATHCRIQHDEEREHGREPETASEDAALEHVVASRLGSAVASHT